MSRHGDKWEEEIKKVAGMWPYICITDMVQHIHDETQRTMKGTMHEDHWFFYHNALSLMKAKDCKEWMSKKGHLCRWMLPVNNLNKGTPFEGHPVGNSQELMPLDYNFFWDINVSVDYHCITTKDFNKNYPKKFSLSSIKGGVHAFLRIMEFCPES